MSSLTYYPEWEAARERLTCWWHGGDIGRAALQIVIPRATPHEVMPSMAEPPGWVTDASMHDPAYRQYLAQRAAADATYFAEAVPSPCPTYLAPNSLALFLGCEGIERPDTVWCRPFLCDDDPGAPAFSYDPNNRYWRYTLAATRAFAAWSRGKSLQSVPDLIEGLDTLEAMRGGQRLLEDLYDRPEWVQASLRQITDLYFRHYDMLYDILRDEVGGSVYWAWAPGRLAKLQCDFSAMISPAMFGEFMVPVLQEMTERLSYSIYHWDGPQAIPHHDHLLALPHLDVLQWTPGAGQYSIADPRWWPIYHKTLDAGKGLMLGMSQDELAIIKREFGAKTKRMICHVTVASAADAEQVIRLMEC
ncbi:MAG TPA: hypothetical protein VGL77_10145 [Armatimonadota bacterium]|jgi:5-methyltetrahydrofolate--homocysteine methyltransferase